MIVIMKPNATAEQVEVVVKRIKKRRIRCTGQSREGTNRHWT